MTHQDAKTFLAGLCLAALLSGGSLAAPGMAFGSGCASGGKAPQSSDTTNGDDAEGDEGEEGEEEDVDGNGA